MKDVVNEALKLDPNKIMDIQGRPEDNFWIYEFEKLEEIDIKGVSVQLMNVIITSGAYPLVATHKDSAGTIHKVALFVEGNTIDEMTGIALAIAEGKEINWMFSGYALPKNNDLIKMRAYHGKFYQK